jgi:hypothetical protein
MVGKEAVHIRNVESSSPQFMLDATQQKEHPSAVTPNTRNE